MYRMVCIIICSLILSFNQTPAQNTINDLNLMPMPNSIEFLQEAEFRISNDFIIKIEGEADNRIYPAATRFLRRLDARVGMFFPQDHIGSADTSDTANVLINCVRPGTVKLGEDESYILVITDSLISINVPSDLGAIHAMETLLQLLSVDDNGYYFPAVKVKDKPRFPWRGLMIDACRHFMPVEMVKRNLDAMSAMKLNVLHWHLSEDQGFRVESKLFPKLHELGSDGFYYSQAQIKDIIKYADERGIRVYPEFDVPGHATSWFVGYPEFASATGPYSIERNWGVFDPTFNPTIEETYEFLDKFFGEMCELFPDEYFHIGGDENSGKQWNENTQIQKFMKENGIKDNHELQAYFNNRILRILTAHGKKMIGWDEILHENMPNNIVIHSWRGKEAMVKAAQQGYSSILSNGYYIDLVQHTDDHYLNDPLPADTPLNDEEKERILGGEATMWAELVTNETVDSRIWPRTAAIAERFWSPREVNDVDNMYRRLERISFLLEEHGLLHIKNYDMMLRRLTNNQDITNLKILVDVLEPVKFYTRHNQGVKYRQYSPYTRVVDAARPDSKVGREFENSVDDYLADKSNEKLKILKEQLLIWQNNHEKLLGTIENSPILKEIVPISLNLSKLAEVGSEALNLLRDGNQAPNPWLSKADSVLLEAEKPYGQTEIRIIAAIKKLVNATIM